jgi:hypothetical protein
VRQSMNLHCTDNMQSIFTAENSSERKEEEEILSFILFKGESVYIRVVPNVFRLSKHRCQKRSDWMFTIDHPIVVNKCRMRGNKK